MSKKLTLQELPLDGKTVLMRVDFNVPFDHEGQISDLSRIEAALPSIRYVLDHGGSLVLVSHLGRPKGKVVQSLSLRPCCEALQKLLDCPVLFFETLDAAETRKLKPGEIGLLENIRFFPAEENPDLDSSLAERLAGLGQLYVTDAFGSLHRRHTSTCTVAEHFPSSAACGFLVEKELKYLAGVLSSPERPFFALVGGSKVSSKLGVLKSLLKRVDGLIVGGAMAFTFLAAQGKRIGSSLFEPKHTKTASDILRIAGELGRPIHLPVDFVIAKNFEEGVETRVAEINEGIPEGWMGLDIGPASVKLFCEALSGAKTVFWNGPMGGFEVPPFDQGTSVLAKALAGLDAVTIIGGGDSALAVRRSGVSTQVSHISTGGGACLEYIEHGSLPGVDVLTDKAVCRK